MAVDLPSLASPIQKILTAPDVDLSSITAGDIRKQLVADGAISRGDIKLYKAEVKTLIKAEFDKINATASAQDGEGEQDDDDEISSSKKRKHESSDAEPEAENEEEEEQSATEEKPIKKKNKKASSIPSDAEVARRLAADLNGRPRRSTAKIAKRTSSAPKRGTSTYKTAAEIDSDVDSDVEKGSSKPVKKRKEASTDDGGGKKGGFHKEYVLSDALADLVGVPRASRPNVVKQLWVYIKGNDLQNPKDRREIVADDKFRAVFGVDKINMMKMNKFLGQHLYDEAT